MGDWGNRLFKRYPDNPILQPSDWPYSVNTIFNPGATLSDDDVLLLVRAEDHRGLSHLTVARSTDGITNWRIDQKPVLSPGEDGEIDEWGVEDPRLTWVPELGEWAITYTAYSRDGPQVALAFTPDFKEFRHVHIDLGPNGKNADKDAAFFPNRIGGRWAIVHRPVFGDAGNIWISFLDNLDLGNWTDSTEVMKARHGAWWDAGKIGLSPPLIDTPDGWLMMYHGVRHTPAGPLYRVGLALLDHDNPTQVVRRADEWVMGPEAPYERTGDVPNVVFSCGWVVRGDDLMMYYGAADTCIGLAIASLTEILDYVKTGTAVYGPRA